MSSHLPCGCLRKGTRKQSGVSLSTGIANYKAVRAGEWKEVRAVDVWGGKSEGRRTCRWVKGGMEGINQMKEPITALLAKAFNKNKMKEQKERTVTERSPAAQKATPFLGNHRSVNWFFSIVCTWFSRVIEKGELTSLGTGNCEKMYTDT